LSELLPKQTLRCGSNLHLKKEAVWFRTPKLCSVFL